MSKRIKRKQTRHPDPTGVIIGFILVALGIAALYGWWIIDPLYFSIPLYIIAILFISLGVFGTIHEFTIGNGIKIDRGNYAAGAMILVWFAAFIYPLITTDTTVLRWIYGIFALPLLLVSIGVLSAQVTKDMRANPKLGWIIAIIIIPGIYIVFSWYFAYPAILLFIPFTFILMYFEYLRTTFLRPEVVKAQDSKAPVKLEADTDTGAIFTSFRGKLAKDVLRNVAGIRWSLWSILIFFFSLFYFLATQVLLSKPNFDSFYEAVIYAYIGILAIVIAFAVLVIERGPREEATQHLKRALSGLIQMYTMFTLITVAGFLLGTDVNGEILTRSVELHEILSSIDNLFNIFRILAIEFAILAFPAGLLYLYAMVKDFLRS